MVQVIANAITHFVGLLTLKVKPQNLNYSINTFALLFIILIVAIKLTIQNIVPQLEKINVLIPILIIAYEGVFLTFLFFLLTKSGKKNRFVQSACNFLGINIISCIISPLISFLPLPLLFLCLIKSWFLIVNFHIIKHAFSVNQIQAMWIYFFMSTITILSITLPFSLFTVFHG
jgi:hypothetical protein